MFTTGWYGNNLLKMMLGTQVKKSLTRNSDVTAGFDCLILPVMSLILKSPPSQIIPLLILDNDTSSSLRDSVEESGL